MKTIILIAGILFLSGNLFSQQQGDCETLRTEKTVFSRTADGYDIKKVYQYDNKGLLTQRVLYMYREYWLPLQKHTLQYNPDKSLKNIFLVRWNEPEGKWRNDVDIQAYYYDESGDCRMIHTRESMDKLLAVK